MANPHRRRALAAALVAAAALAAAGCKSHSVSEQPGGAHARMASGVRMGDPRAGTQLVRGFHGIEAGSWRWTARRFSVVLLLPPGAAQNGATLEFNLTVPDPVIAKLNHVTLTANVGGQDLAPATYSKAGDYVYSAGVPAAAFTGDTARVDFELDNAMPPNPPDLRELGVVAHSVALKPIVKP